MRGDVFKALERISEITKRDILDLFQNGLERDIDILFETEKATYCYYGRLEEIEFLGRLYNLNSMPSLDSRFSDAKGDIWQHTVNNDDYPFCWVFEDERFELKDGSDEKYLKFICEIFHPAVRHEKGYWKEFLDEINKLLQNDGYEIYAAKKISNRDIYGWRVFKPEDNRLFIPYSLRNQKGLKDKKISIKMIARNQIYQLLEKYNNTYRETNETGWNYDITTSEEVFNDIRQFYIPKCYNEKKQYLETSNLEDFVLHSSPYCVIDMIEFFEKYNSDSDFEVQVNAILRLNNIDLKLSNGKIESLFNSQLESVMIAPIQETGLKELIQEATKYYDDDNVKIAVEKLWDAFERLKTYYFPTLDKKKSTNKIINDIANDKKSYIDVFEKEFFELTAIGNNFRIRHHETNKIDIEDKRHYDYFYKRCLSLVSLAIQFLED